MRSQIVKANGELVNVDYMMRPNGDGWLISDIYLDGAISEVPTRRSEFAAIFKNEGVDGLIAALNRKADILAATMARRRSCSPGLSTGPQKQEATVPNLLLVASGFGLVAATLALWVQRWRRSDHRLFAGLISIAVTLSLFSVVAWAA